MVLSVLFLVLLAVPIVLLLADLGRARRDGSPTAPSYGEQLDRRGA